MHILPSSCFSKKLQSPVKSNGDKTIVNHTDGVVEKFIIDNPLIFRICCLCVVRRRMRVDTESKQNGHGNHERNSVEFTRSSTLALDDIVSNDENAKVIGNELTIQPLTLTIGLVESDTASEQSHVVKTQPSAKSREIHHQDMVENYVEDQTRRTTSGKTNSHILSDNENSYNSTPRHEPTSTEFANVRNEIAQIQSAIQSVKKEMQEIQKIQSTNATPLHQPSRPPSVNSNKTFVYENDEVEVVKVEEPKHIEVTVEHVTSRTPSAKSILKTESPFKRIATPTPHDVISDDQVSNSPYDPSSEAQVEYDNEETEEAVSEAIHDEVDHSEVIADPMIMIRTTSKVSLKDLPAEETEAIDTEPEYHEDAMEELPEIAIYRTPQKVINRQPMLKRGHKTTPVKNPMPNIQQTPLVVTRGPKVNPLFPPTLRRYDRPKDACNMCLIQLESANWEDIVEGLKTFVRLIRHHPEYIDAQIHVFTYAIAKQVKNLRSQVSRAACSAAGEFFLTHAKVLDADAEELAAALLNRSADTNKFLRADATKALELMTDALTPTKSVLILTSRGANHQNAAVRCTAAKLLNELVFRIGCDKVFNMHREIRDRLILTGAKLLMEGSLETRNYTKELFKQLSIHSHYQKLLLDVIPPNIYRNIEKALKSI